MDVVGIVAEYNPFHNGHAYQLKKAKEIWGPDVAVVVIMSGPFVQRGEPAIFSKWLRARAALCDGANLILELPFTFACAPAGRFAHGAIQSLAALGVVDHLLFGSECDDISAMYEVADFFADEPAAFSEQIKRHLSKGLSFAAARQKALLDILSKTRPPETCERICKVTENPNTILGIEYLLALKKCQSSIKPHLILRRGAHDHDTDLSQATPSASAIRNEIFTLNDHFLSPKDLAPAVANALYQHLPKTSLSFLLDAQSSGIRPLGLQAFATPIMLSLKTRSVDDIARIAYIDDDLAGRLIGAAASPKSRANTSMWDAFLSGCQTRRYANTRIQRALVSLLFEQTKERLQAHTSPPYLRVLGFDKKGQYLLKIMRKQATKPIVTRASDFLEHQKEPLFWDSARLDLLSQEMCDQAAGYAFDAEYNQRVWQIKNKKHA